MINEIQPISPKYLQSIKECARNIDVDGNYLKLHIAHINTHILRGEEIYLTSCDIAKKAIKIFENSGWKCEYLQDKSWVIKVKFTHE